MTASSPRQAHRLRVAEEQVLEAFAKFTSARPPGTFTDEQDRERFMTELMRCDGIGGGALATFASTIISANEARVAIASLIDRGVLAVRREGTLWLDFVVRGPLYEQREELLSLAC